MIYTLENENIRVVASSNGGELHSIKKINDETEYLWNGDERYWKYHAPVLFPIVGKVNGGKYKIDGIEYELPQHGLARTREFKLIEKSESRIVFELQYDEETLKVYPFKFILRIGYTLMEYGVETSYEVINNDNKDIYFSIGGHPAYMCPINQGESFEDYYFEFDKVEKSSKILLNSNGLFTKNKELFMENSKELPLSIEIFKDDAIVFNDLKSNKISLKSRKSDKSVTMDFSGFPYLGLWTKPTGAPFVCIEPWFGHADYEDFNGDFKDKEGINKLAVGKSFKAAYLVTVQ